MAYADFNTAVGWDKGAEAAYLIWENIWARKVDSKVFGSSGGGPMTSDDAADAGDIVNEMLVRTNAYLRGDSTSGDNPGLYGFAPGFPRFSKEHLSTLKNLKARQSKKVLSSVDLDVTQ